MTTGSDLTRPLSPAAQKAAQLDALGISVNEIAEQTGVTRQMISHYRNNDPRYIELRQQWIEHSLKGLTDLIQGAREDSLKLFRKVLQRLEENLDAEVDGVPLYGVRKDAIKLFFENPAVRQMFKDVMSEGGDTPAVTTNVLVLLEAPAAEAPKHDIEIKPESEEDDG